MCHIHVAVCLVLDVVVPSTQRRRELIKFYHFLFNSLRVIGLIGHKKADISFVFHLTALSVH